MVTYSSCAAMFAPFFQGFLFLFFGLRRTQQYAVLQGEGAEIGGLVWQSNNVLRGNQNSVHS